MLTANALPEHVAPAASAGADRHLAKPITAEKLIQALLDAGGEAEVDLPAAAAGLVTPQASY